MPAQRRRILAAGDGYSRPRLTHVRPSRPPSGPLWGYHLNDVNLALGNLVTDVGLEEAAYR